MSTVERTAEGDGDPGSGPDLPLPDQPLLDLLDALVNGRGRVAAAEALGVNYRTMMACYDSRRVSRRMRQAFAEFRDSAVVGDGDGVADQGTEPLEQRVADLEEEGRGLRELVEAQAGQLQELGRRVARVEEQGQQPGDVEAVGVAGQQSAWRPPRRGHGLPGDGVVTLEQQPDEGHAFGPAEELVAEWRELRARYEKAGNRVRPGQSRGAPVGVGGGVAQRFPTDVAPGEGVAGRSWKGRPPPVEARRPGGSPAGMGEGQAGAVAEAGSDLGSVVEIDGGGDVMGLGEYQGADYGAGDCDDRGARADAASGDVSLRPARLA